MLLQPSLHSRRGGRALPRRTGGFTLLSVLAAIVVLAFGLLMLGKSYIGMTSASTQNQNVASLAVQSNTFWGVVQANRSILATMAGTYTSANIGSAPLVLQDWLTQLLGAASPVALPQGQVVIATGPDAGTGAACSASNGCSVSVTITWAQLTGQIGQGGAAVTRSQTFLYQFGL